MPPTPHVSKIPINKTTKSDDVFLSICKNIYFYSYPAVRLTLSTFYTWYSLQVFLFFPKWAAQVTMAAHLDPMCYLTAIFILYFFIHQTCGGIFLNVFLHSVLCFIYFFPSLFLPPFLSIYPPLTFIWKNIPDALLSFSETWCLFSVP